MKINPAGYNDAIEMSIDRLENAEILGVGPGNGPAVKSLAKHQQMRDALAADICAGEFEVGARLPADRDLALRFGVSYMTARRAIGELVEADLLERRIGDGTYVRAGAQQKLAQTTLNLICSAYGGSTQADFLNLGAELAEKRGWKHHTIRLHPRHERAAVRALESGEFALVLVDDAELEGPLGRALERANGRAVLIGNRLDERGVPSVLADDRKAMQIAVSHLRAAGHKRIGLVANHPQGHNERVQIAAWRDCFPGAGVGELSKRLISAQTPPFQSAIHHAYECVSTWLRDVAPDVSALVCLSDELAIGALAACRDANREVPDAMAMVTLIDNSALAYTHPPMTCVDVDLRGHLECALLMLETALSTPLATKLALIEPKLRIRRSVAAPPVTEIEMHLAPSFTPFSTPELS